MKNSIILLIMGAVACNDGIYEKKYLAALKEHSLSVLNVLKTVIEGSERIWQAQLKFL
jgi:hypothetical protein